MNKLVYPIENGVITNWDAMEEIWSYIFFDQLKMGEDTGILHTEATSNPRANREKIVELMFEKFKQVCSYSFF